MIQQSNFDSRRTHEISKMIGTVSRAKQLTLGVGSATDWKRTIKLFRFDFVEQFSRFPREKCGQAKYLTKLPKCYSELTWVS